MVSTSTSLQQDKYRDSSAYEGTGEHPELFTGVVDDPEAIYNLCLILKIML
jgi:hypothetical protein